ncbi:MAG TPA: gamma-glutamyl-gamma-aminobutyrate hydrolase family protein [Trueperaceae bacterium]|nr:gamma-glutamyl-gamma-aminobutyrate hydrolase family protein [Trueperaceae bacterium]
MKPRIGITVHTYQETARAGHQEARFAVSAQYVRAILDAGGLPLLVPTRAGGAAEPVDVLEAVDGLLFSGGGNLPARTFAGDVSPSLRDTNPERYDYEVRLAGAAREASVPMLGICRGMQTLAEAAGGRLIENLERIPSYRGRHYQSATPETRTHGARLESGSILGRHLPGTSRVNSFHRQAVDVVPDGFRPVAHADDGLVEAIEADDGRVLGTQFHPEWLAAADAGFRAPFAWLVQMATDLRRGPR